MKLKVNPPIALESTELYNGIRFHKGQSTTSGSNQTFTIKPRGTLSFLFVTIIEQKNKTYQAYMSLLGVPYYANEIYKSTINSMPTVTLGGNCNSGITFTFESTNIFEYSPVEISGQW